MAGMSVTEAPFAGALQILDEAMPLSEAYRELSEVLAATEAPLRERPKARPEYIYDQTAFARDVRTALRARGWSHEVPLAPEAWSSGVRIPAVFADMVKGSCQTILEFGNRASWAHNLLTRIALAHGSGRVGITFLVTPMHDFAATIDSNLVSFERVDVEIRRLLRAQPGMIPGPLLLVGVSPTSQTRRMP
jgi:hypothetical protein